MQKDFEQKLFYFSVGFIIALIDVLLVNDDEYEKCSGTTKFRMILAYSIMNYFALKALFGG